MRFLEIQAAGPLQGTVRIPGSKNSSLALLAATCLADEPVTLAHVPDINDVQVVARIIEGIGFELIRSDNGDVTIRQIHNPTGNLDIGLTSSYRASYYFVGALLAKCGKVSIGYPGGDDFVSRPIDQHIKVFEAMGAKVEQFEQHYTVSANRLVGADIYFDVITSGATMNALMLASLADGVTTLRGAATDPEVVDTANLLVQMGANIRGAGTSVIRIEGVKSLGGCNYTVIPDRLIAGSYLAAAAATRGKVTIEGVIPEHLGAILRKLEETGFSPICKDQTVTLDGDMPMRAVRIRTGMYPIFATDMQQPFTAMLLRAGGRSIVTEKVYPKRFSHIDQLRRMGASIELRGASAFIQGNARLHGDWVHAGDIRAGVCLIIAALMAEGVTRLTGVEHLERGYTDIIQSFKQLGAQMEFYDMGNSNYIANQKSGLLY